jgi:hypothetical protein
MEQNKNYEREPYTFTLEFDNGVKFRCNPWNTIPYLHTLEPQGDHLYLFTRDEEGEINWAQRIWRRNLPQFDVLIEKMANDYEMKVAEIMSDEDREAYNDFITQMSHKASNDEKPVTEPQNASELDWISPRQERVIKNAVGFLIYLAENGRLD